MVVEGSGFCVICGQGMGSGHYQHRDFFWKTRAQDFPHDMALAHAGGHFGAPRKTFLFRLYMVKYNLLNRMRYAG